MWDGHFLVGMSSEGQSKQGLEEQYRGQHLDIFFVLIRTKDGLSAKLDPNHTSSYRYFNQYLPIFWKISEMISIGKVEAQFKECFKLKEI